MAKPTTLPTRAELEELADAWMRETFQELGMDAATLNRFKVATDRLKTRLAALVAAKE